MSTPLITRQEAHEDTRYADVRDRRLARKLAQEDLAERIWLNPLERLTCHLHRRRLHDCVHSQVHVIMVTGHRWCRPCQSAASVRVDQLTGDVIVRCLRCDRAPENAARGRR